MDDRELKMEPRISHIPRETLELFAEWFDNPNASPSIVLDCGSTPGMVLREIAFKLGKIEKKQKAIAALNCAKEALNDNK